jgi:hypothetical protein
MGPDVRELNHGHFVILTWFRVSQCVTQVGDYGSLHGAARGPLTRGVGPRYIESLKWFRVSHCVTQVGDYGSLHGAAMARPGVLLHAV